MGSTAQALKLNPRTFELQEPAPNPNALSPSTVERPVLNLETLNPKPETLNPKL